MRQNLYTNAEIQRKVIDSAAGARVEVAAARPGSIVVLLSVYLVAAGAGTIKWESGTTGLTGAMTLATGVPHQLNCQQYGILQTAEGEALNFTQTAVQVSGVATYIYIDAAGNQ